MDIFTTVLTRVVPVPIKPANLKVKALLKAADIGKLTEDFDHLENHDNYFDEEGSKKENKDQSHKEITDQHDKCSDEIKNGDSTLDEHKLVDENLLDNDSNGLSESKDGVKHLDIYI